MSNSKDSALRNRQKAVLAERMRLTDKEDMDACVRDVQASNNLDEGSARIVAAALRGKNLPNIARAAGLDEQVIAQIMGTEMQTADFAKDVPHKSPRHEFAPHDEDAGNESVQEEIDEHGHMPTPDEEMSEGELPSDHSPEVEDAINDAGAGGGGDFHSALPMKKDVNKNDPSEANDEAMATVQIEVPASKLDVIKKALEQALGTGSGDSGGGDEDLNADGGDDFSAPTDDAMGGMPDDLADGNDPHDRSANPMDEKKLAQRKAQREAILAKATRTAGEEEKPKDRGLGKDTSHNGKPFQFGSDAQYKGEDKYPSMTLENSDGNSLRDQNPQFAKQDIPTNNPENLQLQSAYNATKKEGSPDGTLDYDVDFSPLDNIPSGEDGREGDFEVPTQMPDHLNRKTTVAKRIVECMGCTNPDKAPVIACQCQDCNHRVAICNTCVSDEYCPYCEGARTAEKKEEADNEIDMDDPEMSGTVDMTNVKDKLEGLTPKAKKSKASLMVDDKDEEKGDGPRLNVQPNGDGFDHKPKDGPKDEGDFLGDQGRNEGEPGGSKEAQIYRSRLKTAYAVSTRLALAGAIEVSDVENNVDLWMSDGLSARSMLNQGATMLRVTQSASERVADKHNEKGRQVTAGLNINPAVNGSASGATVDLQNALRGLWSTPETQQ